MMNDTLGRIIYKELHHTGDLGAHVQPHSEYNNYMNAP